ncbi:MAG: hypothetical protein EPO68_06065 [Planctomycetota bacterium]|nr:MAG: hypothetical protein EPO68_06065 [Planctomycetota bacterium]
MKLGGIAWVLAAAVVLSSACSVEQYSIASSATASSPELFVAERKVIGADKQSWTLRAFAPNRSIATDWERCLPQVAAEWSRRVVDASDQTWGNHREPDYLFVCREHRVVGLWRGDCMTSLGTELGQSYTDDTDGDGCAEYWSKRDSGWYMLSTQTGRIVRRP